MIDSWDNESFLVEVDGAVVKTVTKHEVFTGTFKFGGHGSYEDRIY